MSADTLKYSKSLPTATGISEICWVGDNVLVGSDSGCAYLWGFDKPEPISTFQEHDLEINSLSVSPSSSTHFLTASSDTSVKLWDTNKISPLNSFDDHEAEVTCVRFSSTDGIFGSTSRDKSLKVWDQRTGKSTLSISHLTSILSLNWSGANHVMFGGEDGSFIIFDTRNISSPVYSKKYSNKITSITSSSTEFVAVTTDSVLEVFSNALTPSSASSSFLTSLLKDDSEHYLRTVSWNPTNPTDLVCGGWNKTLSRYSISSNQDIKSQ
jgi:WD40 repeat protein